jgi:hypothetical protein
MVTAQLDRTANLIPVPPEWLRKQQESRPANANRNINDIYWRKPGGWIVVGPSAVMGGDGRPLTRQAESLMRKGWEPLIEYSYTNRVSPHTGQRDTIEVSADRLNTEDRYYWLFANGGAHLFTIQQIVEHHWHINPPFGLPKSAFPQLEEWDVPDPYYCPACAGSKPPKNSEEEVVQHLMVEHRMTLVQTRDLQQSTNGFRDVPRGATGLAIRRRAAAQVENAVGEAIPPSPDQPQASQFICNQCGEPFKNSGALTRHVKADHADDASPEEDREDA